MKKLFCILSVCLILSVSVVAAFAAPAVNPSGTEIGGALTSSQVVTLSNAAKAECYFLSASSISSGNMGVKEPLMITARSVADQWTYYVYIGDVSASVSDIPEDWSSAGATLHIGVSYLYKCAYNFTASGGLGYQSYVYAANNTLTLPADEQIVYLFKGSGIGLNDTVNFPSIDTVGSNFVAPRRWINALSAFDGSLSPELNKANYDLGYADGQATGYSDGYNAGYQYAESRLPEKIEAAYADGFAAGDSAGYSRAVQQLGEGDDASWYLDVPLIITSIPAAARQILTNAFGFEVFGINIAGLLITLITVCIILWAIHKVTKK